MITNNDLYGNIFNIREKILGDIIIRRKVAQIKNRNSSYDLKKSTIDDMMSLNKNKFYNKSKDFESYNLNNSRKSNVNLPKIFKKAKSNSVVENMLESKRQFHKLKNQEIDLENKKFQKRLVRVKSPFARDKMNESFRHSREYGDIAKKVKDYKFQTKRVQIIKSRLPSIIVNGVDFKKFNL
jgi:hypothetical protein